MASKKEVDELAEKVFLAMVPTLKSSSNVGLADVMAENAYEFAEAFIEKKRARRTSMSASLDAE